MSLTPPPKLDPSANKAREFFKLLVKVAGGVMVLISMAVAVLLAYLAYEKGKYSRLGDTHDLNLRIASMGADYLKARPNCCVVIGVRQGSGQFIGGYGVGTFGDKAAPNGQTMFEIGSITKVFTALCLAQMVEDGRVKLDDRIGQYLPVDVSLPAELQPVTLRQLALHSSGLPRLPDNFDLSPATASNPYSHYTSADLYHYLAKARVQRPPGTASEYSNLGYGLLGHLLELKSGKKYEELVREIVCSRIGLTNTLIHLTTEQKARMAPGHDEKGSVVSNWDMDVMAPAGALRSCADDLLKFVEANLSAPAGTPIGKVIQRAQQNEQEIGVSGATLGWQTTKSLQGGLNLFWQNGGTGGYVSFIGFDREHQTGVVILSNSGDAMAGKSDVDRIGMEILKLASKVSIF